MPRRDEEPIQNYLVFAILVIFCCWPLAIPAIMNATKVNTLQQQGDYEGALEASRQAKKWSIIALCAGLASNIIFCIVGVGAQVLIQMQKR